MRLSARRPTAGCAARRGARTTGRRIRSSARRTGLGGGSSRGPGAFASIVESVAACKSRRRAPITTARFRCGRPPAPAYFGEPGDRRSSRRSSGPRNAGATRASSPRGAHVCRAATVSGLLRRGSPKPMGDINESRYRTKGGSTRPRRHQATPAGHVGRAVTMPSSAPPCRSSASRFAKHSTCMQASTCSTSRPATAMRRWPPRGAGATSPRPITCQRCSSTAAGGPGRRAGGEVR